VADKKIRYGWAWLLFLAATLVGAGMMLADRALLRNIGIILLAAPLLLLGGLSALYYVQSKRHAK